MATANPFIPSPTAVNRSAPTGANIPSISLPQNHTLASDPMNQLAQTLAMGMNVPAYDPYGNNGYYSRQTAQTSPLMQRYLKPENNTQNPWLTTAMQRGMPGWTSNGDGSFKPAAYNPFQGLNTPPTQGGLPAQQPAQQSFTPEFISNAQSVGLSPEVAYAYQNDPQVKAYFDALNAQKAGASPASDGAQSTAPNVGTMTANENRTMTFEGAAPTQLKTPGEIASAVWRQRYMSNGQIDPNAPTIAQVYANAKKLLDSGGTIYDNALSSVGYVPQGGESVGGGVHGGWVRGSTSVVNGRVVSTPAHRVAESPASTARLALLSGDNPYGTVPVNSQLDQATYNAYMSDPAVKAYFDALNAQK